MATTKYTPKDPGYFFSGDLLNEYSTAKDDVISYYSGMCKDLIDNLNKELKTQDEIDNYNDSIEKVFTDQSIKDALSDKCKITDSNKKTERIKLLIKGLNSLVQQL